MGPLTEEHRPRIRAPAGRSTQPSLTQLGRKPCATTTDTILDFVRAAGTFDEEKIAARCLNKPAFDQVICALWGSSRDAKLGARTSAAWTGPAAVLLGASKT